jgi:hypothetical protein
MPPRPCEVTARLVRERGVMGWALLRRSASACQWARARFSGGSNRQNPNESRVRLISVSHIRIRTSIRIRVGVQYGGSTDERRGPTCHGDVCAISPAERREVACAVAA